MEVVLMCVKNVWWVSAFRAGETSETRHISAGGLLLELFLQCWSTVPSCPFSYLTQCPLLACTHAIMPPYHNHCHACRRATSQGYQAAIAGARALSEKATAGAAAAAARAEEVDALLQKAEARIGERLDEAIHNQVFHLDACG